MFSIEFNKLEYKKGQHSPAIMRRDNPKEIDYMVSILIRKGKEVAPLGLLENREEHKELGYYLKTQPKAGPQQCYTSKVQLLH